MKAPNLRVLISTFMVLAIMVLAISGLHAQNTAQPDYLNTTLAPERRAADLVHRMTPEEKVTQLTNMSRAIPRLNIPFYDWWSESLHGVARNGTTDFPQPIRLLSAFDTDERNAIASANQTE